MNNELTFELLEAQLGQQSEGNFKAVASPLDTWYDSVRQLRLTDLSIRDLCIACRQGLFPEHVLPIALQRLHETPLAGHQFDGELLSAMRYVQLKYWRDHPEDAHKLKDVLENLSADEDDVSEIRQELQKLIAIT